MYGEFMPGTVAGCSEFSFTIACEGSRRAGSRSWLDVPDAVEGTGFRCDNVGSGGSSVVATEGVPACRNGPDGGAYVCWFGFPGLFGFSCS